MKKRIIAILLLTVFTLLFLSSCAATARDVHHDIGEYILTYDIGDKSDFRILQLSDIHVANKDDRSRQYDFIAETVRRANADMIVITGDLFTFADKKTAKELFAFLDGFGIPWTLTFGNHDEQCYFPIDWLTDYLNNYGSNCLFRDIQDDDVYGNANFAINLTKNGELFEQVIIMDSNRYYYGEYFGYDFIKDSQIAWYRDLVSYTTAQNGGVVADSLLYFHIPLPEWNDAYLDWQAGGDTEYILGTRGEESSPPEYNSGFFDTILELGSTKAISVGHDHVNDMILRYKGVYLCYGVHSTDRIYHDKDLLGGRILALDADGNISFDSVKHSYGEEAKK